MSDTMRMFLFFWTIGLIDVTVVIYHIWPRRIIDNPCGRPPHELVFRHGEGCGEEW